MGELVPRSEVTLAEIKDGAVEGMALIPTEGMYIKVFDYLFRMIFRHHASVSEMLMEDSCALSAGEMKYFPASLYGMIPSYGYWKLYYNRLPRELRDEFEVTEREILKSRYVKEMVSIAEMSEGDASDARLFSFWHKLHSIEDKAQARLEQRMIKRELKDAGFNQGVDKTLEIIRKIKDSDLLEMKTVIEGVAREIKGE